MKKILLFTFLFIALCSQAQINYYPFNAGQYLIYDVGAEMTTTVETPKHADGGVIAYRNSVEVIDTIVHVTSLTSLDTLSSFTRPAGKKMAIGIPRGGVYRQSLPVYDDSLIYFARGSGVKPIINGADNNFTWSPDYIASYDTAYPVLGTDDAYVRNGTTINLVNADNNLGSNWTDQSDTILLRFNNVNIPKDATVINSKVVFTVNYYVSGSPVNVAIKGEDNVSPATFSDLTDYHNRTMTTQVVSWDNIPLTAVGNTLTSPDISSIVSHITSKEGWVSGNNLVLFFGDNNSTDKAKRTVASTENTTYSEPMLITQYGAAVDNNIWSISYNGDAHYVIVDDTVYTPAASKAELVPYTFYNNTAIDSLSIYTEIDPFLRNIEVPIRTVGISLNGVKEITVKSIDMRGFTYAAIRGLNSMPNSNTLITDCDFSRNRISAVQFYSGYNDATIQNCYAYDNGNGFYANEADSIYFLNNTVIRSRPGSGIDGHGIGAYRANWCIFDGNYLEDNYSNLNLASDGDVAMNSTIRNNTFANPYGGSENMSTPTLVSNADFYVYNNLFINSSLSGSTIAAGSTGYIYNNTFANVGVSAGMIYTPNADNHVIKNNIFYSTGTGGYVFIISAGTPVSDNNLFYTPNLSTPIDGYNFAGWKTATSQDANSVNADPIFTDAANGDYTLQSGSPAINAGTDVGLTHDINGNPIVGNPDIGAYEKQ